MWGPSPRPAPSPFLDPPMADIQTTLTPAAPPIAWHQWIGLPHQLGADPRDGRACCCLELWFAVCDLAGIHIHEKDFMRMLARNNEPDRYGRNQSMDAIAKAAADFTHLIGTDPPQSGDMALAYSHRRGEPPVGLIVVADDVELLMTHTIGLRSARIGRHHWRRYGMKPG